MQAQMPVAHAHEHTNSNRASCPQCGGHLCRTWRRPIDRFLSIVNPVHRFRCEHFACQWEGNFRAVRKDFVQLSAGDQLDGFPPDGVSRTARS